MNMDYKFKKEVNTSFDDTINNIKKELKKEGFGVLTEIDVKQTIKNKLNIDMDKYIILGACNPVNANKAINYEIDVGLMLPCNIVVYENNKRLFVSVIRPTIAMGMIDNSKLKDVAFQIESKLKNVFDSI